jgi:hypothetical protein
MGVTLISETTGGALGSFIFCSLLIASRAAFSESDSRFVPVALQIDSTRDDADLDGY